MHLNHSFSGYSFVGCLGKICMHNQPFTKFSEVCTFHWQLQVITLLVPGRIVHQRNVHWTFRPKRNFHWMFSPLWHFILVTIWHPFITSRDFSISVTSCPRETFYFWCDILSMRTCVCCDGSWEPVSRYRADECIFGGEKTSGGPDFGMRELMSKGREMGSSVYKQTETEVDGSCHS
jgi:hypothetical protein